MGHVYGRTGRLTWSGCCLDASTICSASWPFRAMGLSHMTCLPASKAAAQAKPEF